MLEAGLRHLVEPEVVERARPRFSVNDDFDFSVFNERFDFVYARSIWTHASKPQIRSMLSSFASTTSPGAAFLASYYPASQLFRLSRRWWLNRPARPESELAPYPIFNRHYWLRIVHAPGP